MHGDRFLLGIWSKINLHNNTFQSRKVTAAPTYYYDPVNGSNYDYEYKYDRNNDFNNQTNLDNLYEKSKVDYDQNYDQSNGYKHSDNTNSAGGLNHSAHIMDISSPLNNVNSFLFPTSTMASTTTIGKTSDRLHPRLRQIIDEIKQECIRRQEQTPILQSGRNLAFECC